MSQTDMDDKLMGGGCADELYIKKLAHSFGFALIQFSDPIPHRIQRGYEVALFKGLSTLNPTQYIFYHVGGIDGAPSDIMFTIQTSEGLRYFDLSIPPVLN